MLNFCNFYQSLDKTQRMVFRDTLDIQLDWGKSTFYYKMNHGHLTKLEEEKISLILSDFKNRYDSYLYDVILHIIKGHQLHRDTSPRKDLKYPNKLIYQRYESLSKITLPTETCL